MEARARAAVAKLQELTQGGAAKEGTATPAAGTATPADEPAPAAETPAAKPAELGSDDAETISRTLLLAQRTADATVAEAKPRPSDRRRSHAEAAKIVEDAKVEGRKANEDRADQGRGRGPGAGGPPRLPASATSTRSSSTSSPSASGCATRPPAIDEMVERVPGRARRRPPARCCRPATRPASGTTRCTEDSVRQVLDADEDGRQRSSSTDRCLEQRYPRRPTAALVPRARDGRSSAVLGARRHVPGVDRPARRRRGVRVLRRSAVRQRPAALRPPADRLRQGRRAALPDDARPARRAPLRLGLPRPARRGRQAEKELGISGHPEITRFGIDKFNDACRTSVLRYTDEWHRYVTRQARWVDFENDYKTLDLPYMESVMWAFKTLWDKGLIYEGFKVLAYCWRCETPLSNTETRMDDVYRDRQDPALTVMFELETGERILIWTTTPWTLPSNLALAVGPDIDYAVMEEDGHALHPRRGPPRGVRARAGRRHAGRPRSRAASSSAGGTRRCSPFLADTPNAFQVLGRRLRLHRGGHRRRAHGPRLRRGRPDRVQRRRHPDDLPDGRARPVHGRDRPVGRRQHVFDANPLVIQRAQGPQASSSATTRYDHSYPHCWRCARAARLPGDHARGSSRSPSSATGWSSSTSRSAGCPSTSRRAASASGWPTPATGRSAATASGARRSRCGRATTRPTRASTSTARSPTSSATSA